MTLYFPKEGLPHIVTPYISCGYFTTHITSKPAFGTQTWLT